MKHYLQQFASLFLLVIIMPLHALASGHTATASSTPICQNSTCTGSATATVFGGTGPFTYTWTPGNFTGQTVTGLCAGNYTCIVTDNSDMSTAMATVGVWNSTLNTFNRIVESCGSNCNGWSSAVAGGGAPPFVYLWSTGQTDSNVTGLCGGQTYTCTITDTYGCDVQQLFTVLSPDVLGEVLTSTPSCANANTGTATIDLQQGSYGPYTFAWPFNSSVSSTASSSTATNLSPGSAAVNVTSMYGCYYNFYINVGQATPIALSTTQTNVSCNGGSNGSATVTVSGGTAPYSYQWSPLGGTNATASGLSAGTYTVSVTDAVGCNATASVSITQPAPVPVSAGPDKYICQGGSTQLNATGANTYLWTPATALSCSNCASPTVSPTVTMNYTVIGTSASGCIGADVVMVFVTNISLTVSAYPATCNISNGNATVSPSGGTAPYTYSWSPSGHTTQAATNLAPGTHSVTVVDAMGCTRTATISVNSVTPPVISIASVTPATCNQNNGAITTAVSGGTSPYTYSWAPNTFFGPNITNRPPGTYTITVADANGCSATASATIPSQPGVTLSMSVNTATCSQSNGSATVTPTSGTAPFTYSWNTSPVQTTQTATNLAAGNYTVTVNDANNCSATSVATINNTNGPSVTMSSSNVTCFNGTNGTATANVTGGTPPYSYLWSPGNVTTSSAGNLTAGTYSINVTDNLGCSTFSTVTITQPLQMSVSVSSSASCPNMSNGWAASSVTGGTPPYTYLWSQVGSTNSLAQNLWPGIYTLDVTDTAGCSTQVTVGVTSFPPIGLNAGPDIAICQGSSTMLTGSGSGVWSYSWIPASSISCSSCASTLASPAVSTSYTLIATDVNNCMESDMVTVTVNPGPVLTTSSTQATGCSQPNGSATVNISGGVPPYSYTWNTNPNQTTATASNLSPGIYTVTVTDANNACIAQASATVISPSPISATVTTYNTCSNMANGGANVVVTGGTGPYVYQWSNGSTGQYASNLTVGMYSVTVYDASGCNVTASGVVYATYGYYLAVTGVNANCTTNGSANAQIVGGTGPFTYAWSTNPVQTTSTATNLSPGQYSVTVTELNGCSRTGYIYIGNDCKNYVRGRLYNDLNGNCVQDAGENSIANKMIRLMPTNVFSLTNSLGDYSIGVQGAGTYTVMQANPGYWQTVCPAGSSHTVTFSQLGGDTLFNKDFAIHIPAVQDLRVMLSTGLARPGFIQGNYINYYNDGTIPMNATIQFTHDSILSYVSSSPLASNYTYPTLEWTVNLQPGQSGSIYVTTLVPTMQNGGYIGRQLFTAIRILPILGDTTPANNASDDIRLIQASFDPNLKEVQPGNNGSITPADSILKYTIHFQNTGNDTAFTVVVRDTLSPYLDPGTIEPGAGSHPYIMEMEPGNVLKFTFNSILLTDSTTNEPASHGFVTFTIKQNPGNPPGTVITNEADNYFDFNPPITTNMVSSTIDMPVSIIDPAIKPGVAVYPNPFSDEAIVVVSGAEKGKELTLGLYNVLGEKVHSAVSSNGQFTIRKSDLAAGIYFYRIAAKEKIIANGKVVAK